MVDWSYYITKNDGGICYILLNFINCCIGYDSIYLHKFYGSWYDYPLINSKLTIYNLISSDVKNCN